MPTHYKYSIPNDGSGHIVFLQLAIGNVKTGSDYQGFDGAAADLYSTSQSSEFQYFRTVFADLQEKIGTRKYVSAAILLTGWQNSFCNMISDVFCLLIFRKKGKFKKSKRLLLLLDIQQYYILHYLYSNHVRKLDKIQLLIS
jgi:hypothetical protein